MLKREDIVDRMADKGYTKKSARVILDDFVRVISEALVEGEEVRIRGFGTFAVRDAGAREMNDYQSGERITIPGHRVPKFTPGQQLRRWVADGIIRE